MQLFVSVTVESNAASSLLIEDTALDTSLMLHGDHQSTSTRYQPVLLANHTYRLTWNRQVLAKNVHLSVHNLPR